MLAIKALLYNRVLYPGEIINFIILSIYLNGITEDGNWEHTKILGI